MKSFRNIFFLIPMIGLVACSTNDPAVIEEDEFPAVSRSIVLTPAENAVAVQNGDFAWRLLHIVACDNADAAVDCISPINTSVTLSILANGVDEGTKQEIYSVLGYDGLDAEAVNSLNKKLLSELESVDTQATLRIANSLWKEEDYYIAPSLIEMLQNDYGIETLTMHPDTWGHDLIKWASQHTDGLIDYISQPRVEDCYACNLACFNGKWHKSVKFDKKDTKVGIFHNALGVEPASNVLFMSTNSKLGYYENEAFQYASLPFGGGSFCLSIFLPKSDDFRHKDLIESVQAIGWSQLQSDMQLYQVQLTLPKIKLGAQATLRDYLWKAGMRKLFDNVSEANDERPFRMQDLHQKSQFNIDEEGVAIATTGGGPSWSWSTGAAGEAKMVVDRPFVFTLSESSTNCILYIGKVNSLPDIYTSQD